MEWRQRQEWTTSVLRLNVWCNWQMVAINSQHHWTYPIRNRNRRTQGPSPVTWWAAFWPTWSRSSRNQYRKCRSASRSRRSRAGKCRWWRCIWAEARWRRSWTRATNCSGRRKCRCRATRRASDKCEKCTSARTRVATKCTAKAAISRPTTGRIQVSFQHFSHTLKLADRWSGNKLLQASIPRGRFTFNRRKRKSNLSLLWLIATWTSIQKSYFLSQEFGDLELCRHSGESWELPSGGRDI